MSCVFCMVQNLYGVSEPSDIHLSHNKVIRWRKVDQSVDKMVVGLVCNAMADLL